MLFWKCGSSYFEVALRNYWLHVEETLHPEVVHLILHCCWKKSSVINICFWKPCIIEVAALIWWNPFAGQLSCFSFPSHEEEFLRNTVGAALYILVLGQDCAARYQLLNCLLGERLLPLGAEAGEACSGVHGIVCKRRKLCFTHGRQTRLSLALPGQYELVHQLAANRGRWDTVPREDLEIHKECEDPAHRLAELEITLHHPLLQVGCSHSRFLQLFTFTYWTLHTAQTQYPTNCS